MKPNDKLARNSPHRGPAGIAPPIPSTPGVAAVSPNCGAERTAPLRLDVGTRLEFAGRRHLYLGRTANGRHVLAPCDMNDVDRSSRLRIVILPADSLLVVSGGRPNGSRRIAGTLTLWRRPSTDAVA